MPQAYGLIHFENDVYGVSFPDFPGCVTAADTLEDAVRKADEVLTFHVAGMVEDGDEFPVVRTLKELLNDADFSAAIKANAVMFLANYERPAKAVRINISIEESLLAIIDRATATMGGNRSAFLAEAAREKIVRGG